MTDDDDRAEQVRNAELLANLARQGMLDPCEWCSVRPTIDKDPDGLPMVAHGHDEFCPVNVEAECAPAAGVDFDSPEWKRFRG